MNNRNSIFPSMPDRHVVWLITLVGLGYRLLTFAFFYDKIVPGSDAIRNIRMGQKFASGVFSGILDVYWPPLYPLLIGLTSMIVDELVIPAVIVSILAGTLGVTLIYLFVAQSYGRDAAIIAAVLASFYPFLVNSVFALGTENIYLPCILVCLVMFWRGLEKGKIVDFLTSGALLAFAYLSRPEAIGYLVFLSALIVFNHLWQKDSGNKPFVQVCAVFLAFFLIAGPYLYYLKVETGQWTISGKVGKNFASGVFSNDGVDEGQLPELEERSGPVTERELISNFIFNFRLAQSAISLLIPMFLMALVGLGLGGRKWHLERLKREIFLISFCLFTVVIYSASWVLERYLYILIPCFLGWIALGILNLQSWYLRSSRIWITMLPRVRRDFFVLFCICSIYVYLFPINFYVRSQQSDWQARSYEERDAGHWLIQNGGPHLNLFSLSNKTAFYAKGIRFWTESKTTDEIINEIKSCGGPKVRIDAPVDHPCKIDYVVSSERHNVKYPYLENLTPVLEQDADFRKVFENTEQPGYEITIFEYLGSQRH